MFSLKILPLFLVGAFEWQGAVGATVIGSDSITFDQAQPTQITIDAAFFKELVDNVTKLQALHPEGGKSCKELFDKGKRISGTEAIDPDGAGVMELECDQTTAGGGWTLVAGRTGDAYDMVSSVVGTPESGNFSVYPRFSAAGVLGPGQEFLIKFGTALTLHVKNMFQSSFSIVKVGGTGTNLPVWDSTSEISLLPKCSNSCQDGCSSYPCKAWQGAVHPKHLSISFTSYAACGGYRCSDWCGQAGDRLINLVHSASDFGKSEYCYSSVNTGMQSFSPFSGGIAYFVR